MTENNSVFFTDFDDLKKDLNNDDEDQPILNLASVSGREEQPEWFTEDYEGQLAVDVYQDKENIYVAATIAGVKTKDLDIYLHNDLLTIRGKREHQTEAKEEDYFYKECYWGGFSRSIILPVEVQADKVEAEMRDGVLKVTLPKAEKSKLVNVEIKEK